jgi:hypothetical protein
MPGEDTDIDRYLPSNKHNNALQMVKVCISPLMKEAVRRAVTGPLDTPLRIAKMRRFLERALHTNLKRFLERIALDDVSVTSIRCDLERALRLADGALKSGKPAVIKVIRDFADVLMKHPDGDDDGDDEREPERAKECNNDKNAATTDTPLRPSANVADAGADAEADADAEAEGVNAADIELDVPVPGHDLALSSHHPVARSSEMEAGQRPGGDDLAATEEVSVGDDDADSDADMTEKPEISEAPEEEEEDEDAGDAEKDSDYNISRRLDYDNYTRRKILWDTPT